MNPKTDDLQEAWGAFFLAHALAIRSIEAHMGNKAPLSMDEYDVLLSITRHPTERPRFSELASATVFTRSGITRIARRLEERKLLARENCEEDRRGAYAVVTTQGREAMKETWRLYSKAIIALLEPCFDKAETKTFTKLLERIIEQTRTRSLVQIGRSLR